MRRDNPGRGHRQVVMLDLKRRLDILRGQDRPLRFLLAQCLRRTRLCRFFRIPLQDCVLHFHPSALSAALWMNPGDRQRDSAFLARYLTEGDVYIDVGANIGSTAVPASRLVGKSGLVLAFEPHPRIYRFLLDNLRLNRCGNVTSYPVALGEQEATAAFSDLSPDDENRVLTTLGPLQVAMQPLDHYTRSLDHVALLKIDVEGYEKQVILGAEETLARTACLYFEADQRLCSRYGYPIDDLLRLLAARGFTVFMRTEDTKARRLEPGMLREGTPDNLIAIRDVPDFVRRTGWELTDRR